MFAFEPKHRRVSCPSDRESRTTRSRPTTVPARFGHTGHPGSNPGGERRFSEVASRPAPPIIGLASTTAVARSALAAVQRSDAPSSTDRPPRSLIGQALHPPGETCRSSVPFWLRERQMRMPAPRRLLYGLVVPRRFAPRRGHVAWKEQRRWRNQLCRQVPATIRQRPGRSAPLWITPVPVPASAVLMTTVAVRVGHLYPSSWSWDLGFGSSMAAALLGSVLAARAGGLLGVAPVLGDAGDGQGLLLVPWRRPHVFHVQTPAGPAAYRRRRSHGRTWFERDRWTDPDHAERSCALMSAESRLRLSCHGVVGFPSAALVVAPHHAVVASAFAAGTAAPLGWLCGCQRHRMVIRRHEVNQSPGGC